MKAFNWIRNILCVFAVIILIAAAACLILRWKPAVVMSDSMEPIFSHGAVVFVDANASYDVGDIIAFHDASAYVTHRLIDKEEDEDTGKVLYTTKGDNNEIEDVAKITDEDIEGKVVFWIPKVGYVFNFLSRKYVIIIGAALILCLFLANFLTSDAEDAEKAKAESEAAMQTMVSKATSGLQTEMDDLQASLTLANDKLAEANARIEKYERHYSRLHKRHFQIIDILVSKKVFTEDFAAKEKAAFRSIKEI